MTMASSSTKSELPSYSNQPERDPPGYSLHQPQPMPNMGGPQVAMVGVNVGQRQIVVPLVVTQVVSPKPMPMVCKSCNMDVTTKVDKKASTKTHLFAGLMCLFGCWCCVCIPYCTDSCQNKQHYCPNCNAYIGTYKW